MFKLIFFLIIIGLFIVLFNEAIVDTSSMMAVAITSLSGAFTLILSIVIVPFTVMLDFYYIKLALYIGLFIFTLSYIIKWLTGHHLTSEEDIEEESDPYNLSKRDLYDLQKQAESYSSMKSKSAIVNRTNTRKKEDTSDIDKQIAEWKERRKKK